MDDPVKNFVSDGTLLREKPSAPSPSIPLGGTQLRSLVDRPGQLEFVRATAPGHGTWDNAFMIKTEDQANMEREAIRASHQSTAARPHRTIIARGVTLYDTKKNKKVTVIKANAGTSSSGKPMHKVVDRNGDSWLAKERHLVELPR